VGTIYWFVSYEFVGTVMCSVRAATGLAFIILFIRRDRKVRAAPARGRAGDGRSRRGRSVPVPTGRSVTSRGVPTWRGAAVVGFGIW
jgi:hypothetical protein